VVGAVEIPGVESGEILQGSEDLIPSSYYAVLSESLSMGGKKINWNSAKDAHRESNS